MGTDDRRRGEAAQEVAAARPLRVALVNNMPDAAFAETDRQFSSLLSAAAGGSGLVVERYLLDAVPRSPSLREGPAAGYRGLRELLASRPDGVVVTGAEPLAGRLADEPLFGPMAAIFDWAAAAVPSLVCSCLAAHAAALHFDGIDRRRLEAKCFGVLEERPAPRHPLSAGLPRRVDFPHSRLNDLPLDELVASGYVPVVAGAGHWTVAAAVRGGCLVVLVQGHPEYGADTLLREYRRDLRRHLAGEQPIFPELPGRYLDRAGRTALGRFARTARAPSAGVQLLEGFPFEEVAAGIAHAWSAPAVALYANWLAELGRHGRPVGGRAAPEPAHA